jgi:hypothetical protein
MNQLSLPLAIQAPPFGALSREAAGEGYLQALLHKPLLDTNHRAATDGEGLGNLSISRLWFSLKLIAHQQNSCH